jgi:hypothetical protein
VVFQFVLVHIKLLEIVVQVLGQCELFEERQVGNERFNIFTGCPGGETATIVLRGGADQVRFGKLTYVIKNSATLLFFWTEQFSLICLLGSRYIKKLGRIPKLYPNDLVSLVIGISYDLTSSICCDRRA